MKVIHARLVRGLQFIQSLVTANVQELQSYMTELSTLLLDCASSRGSTLAGATVYETYLVSVILYPVSSTNASFQRISLNALLIVLVPSNNGSGLLR